MSPLPAPSTPLPDAQARPVNRAYHFLWLLAETFAYEIDHEMRLRLEGATPLPSEWVVYLEREHREILQQMKRLGDVESNAPSTSTHNISEYASGLNSTHDVRSPCHWQDKERIHRSVLPEIDGTFYIYKINPLSRLTNNYS